MAATTELRLLVDLDRSAATGCSAFGMQGIEQVVTTVLQQDEQGARVVATRRSLCAAGVLGDAVDIETTGWPAVSTSARSVIESRVPFSVLGTTRTQPVHAGFAITSGSTTTTLIEQDGSPIVVPRPLESRRRAASPASGDLQLTLDGQVGDWNAVEPIAEGSGALQRVYIYGGPTDLYLRFELAAAVLTVNPDSYVVRQGKILSIGAPGVLANDSAPEGRKLTAAAGTQGAHGTVAMTAEGGFTYVHDGTAVPVDTFDYGASDGSTSATGTVTINVTPNGRPAAVADTYDVAHRGTIDIPAPGVLANDSDPESDRLRASLVTAPANGSLTLDGNGRFVYEHNGSDTREDRFVYRASDLVSVASATVTINIGANVAPVAAADAFTTSEGATLTVDAANGLLANDSDTDTPRSFWTATAITQPVHGTLVLHSDGSFTYTHDGGETTTDSFTYRTRDGIAGSAVVTVSLTITAVNDAPVAAGDAYSTDEDAALTIPVAGVLANDSDADGDTLTAVVVTPPSLGSVTLAPNGSFVYTPTPDANGSDSFTYRAADSAGAASTATVTITIAPLNDAPSFTIGGDPASVNEDAGGQTVPSFATAISAGPGETESVSFTVVSNSNASLFSVAPAIDPSGTLTYTAAANANGSASLVIRLVDSGASAAPHVNESVTRQFTIDVQAVNDPPQFTAGAAVTVEEDSGPYSAVWASSISAGPADEAAQSVSFTVTATNGALFSAAPAIAADGTLTFTPAPHAFGTATITVSALDSAAGSTSPQTFPLHITPINDAPGFVIASAPAAVSEDAGPQTVASFATSISSGPGESDAIAFVVVSNDLPSLFAAPPAIDGAGTLTYTAAANASGVANVQVKLTDVAGGESAPQSFTINVLAVNDAPSFSAPGTVTAAEDSGAYSAAFAASILAGPADENAQSVSFTIDSVSNVALFASAPAIASDGTLTFTPAADAFGSAVVTFHAIDSDGSSTAPQSVTITINAVNDPPSFNITDPVAVSEDAGAQSVTAVATAITPGPLESESVGFIITGNSRPSLFAVAPALDASGTLTYTPATDASGSATILVKLTDAAGGESAPKPFTITVNAVNDPPSFAASSSVTVNEDSGGYSAGFATAISAGPADENTQTVTFAVSNDNNLLFSVQPAISDAGVLTFTPAADRSGSATVTVTATDSAGASTAPRTFSLDVTAVNDAPSFSVGANVTVGEDSGAYSVAQVTAISPGANESDNVTFAVTNDANLLFLGQPLIDASGNLTFTPAANANGVATVSVIANDDGGTADGGVSASAPQTFTITINAVNDAPDYTSGANVTVLEDSAAYNAAWASAISPGPADENSQTVSFSVSNDANALFISQPAIDAAGSLTFTPAANRFGVATVTVTATDTDGASAVPRTFTITVTNVNDAPSFSAGSNVTVAEDSAAYSAAQLTGISAGPHESDSVTFVVSNDANVLFSVQPLIDAAGTLTFTPAANANGVATVSVIANDDGGTANGGVSASAPQTFTITINAVNDAPDYTSGPNVTVLEDSAAYNAAWASAISPGPADENSQTMSFSVSNDANTLFSSQPAIDAAGSLTFTPAANRFGVATVTVTATDTDGASAVPRTFTITVTNINDAPAFSAGSNVTVAEDSAAYSAAQLTGISAGPHESDSVTFAVTNDANALFLSPPAIDAAGTLTFTPAANANGVATVTVVANDNGGTDNAGASASAPQTFTITINALNDSPVATDDSYVVAEGGTLAPAAALGVKANDSDVDGDAFNVALVAGPASASSFTLNADGSFSYVHNGTSTPTTDSFTYRLTDTPAGAVSNTATVTITITPVNDAPVAIGDSYVYPAAGTLSVTAAAGLLANDTDEENASLTAQLVSGPPAGDGTLALSSDGSFTFTKNAPAGLHTTFTYRVSDGTTTSAPATVTITFNSAPVAVADSFATAEDVELVVAAPGLRANDTDNENNITRVILVSGPSVGTFSTPAAPGDDALLDDGSFRYTPPADHVGNATFTYKLEDGGGLQSNTVTATINITAVNDAPFFAPGAATITVNEDAAVQNIVWPTSIRPGPVTATDEAGQTLTFTAAPSSTTLLQNGTVACLYDPAANPGDPITCNVTTKPVAIDPTTGVVTFKPAANQHGTTTVAIYLRDGGGTADGGVDRYPAAPAVTTFDIVVNPVNDAPTLTRGPNLIVPVNAAATPHSFPGWATNITAGPNEADQTLTLTVTASNPALFSVQPAIDKVTGNLTFTTAPNASGVSDIQANLSDNGGPGPGFLNQQFSNAIFIGNKNDAPSFTPGSNVTVNEDSGAQTIDNWATNISQGGDDAGQVVTFTVLYTPTSLFSSAPVVLGTNTATPGRLQFTPAANQFGTATLNITAKDNGGTAGGGSDTGVSQFITITINPVNDPPDFIASNVGVPVSASTPTPYSIADWVKNITFTPDAAGQAISARTVTVLTGANLFAPGGAPAIDASNTLTFTAAVGQSGSATVNVTLTDDGGTPADPSDDASKAKPYTIGVGVNSPPSFTAGANVIAVEDSGTTTITGWATNISSGYPGEPAQGVNFTVTVTSGGALFSAAPAVSPSGDLTFTAGANQSGVATVSVVAKDNGGTAGGGVDTSAAQTFTITLSAVNDAPTFTIPAYAPPVAANVVTQTVAVFASSLSAGPNESGQTPWTFLIDSNSNPSLFAAQPAINGTNGNLTYRPAAGKTGSADIGVKMKDSGGTAGGGVDTSIVKTFRINVGTANLAPTFTKGANQTVNEEAPPVTVNSWATAISAGAGETTQTVTQFNVSCTNPSFFSTAPAISAAGTLTYTVAVNQSGASTCTVTAKDDGGTANGGADTSTPQTFSITINPINDPPTFTLSASDTVAESASPGQRSRTNFATALTSGPNETGQTLTFEIVDNTNAALFTTQPVLTVAGASGTLTYTPKANTFGTATITVRLKDNGSAIAPNANTSASVTFDIIVTELNDPPVATNKSISTYSGIEVTIRNVDTGYRLLDGATDPNGTSTFTVGTISNLKAGARVTVTDAATGAFKYDPAPGTGTQTFNYTVCDTGLGAQGARCSSAATVTVSVGGSNVMFASPTGSGSTCSYTNPCSYSGLRLVGGFEGRPANGTLIFLSGTYTLTTQEDGPSVWLAAGEKVIGQGAGGNYDTTYGIGSIPVGVLAARPNLASGTRPVLNKTSGNPLFVMDTPGTRVTYFELSHSSNTAITTYGDDLTGAIIDRVKMGGGFSMYGGGSGSPAPAQGLSVTNSEINGRVFLGSDRGPVAFTNTPITVPNAININSGFQIFNTRTPITFVNSPVSITSSNNFDQALYLNSTADVTFDATSTVTLTNARMWLTYVRNLTFNGRVSVTWTNLNAANYHQGAIWVMDAFGLKMLAANNTISSTDAHALSIRNMNFAGTTNDIRVQTINVTRSAVASGNMLAGVEVDNVRGPINAGAVNRNGANIECLYAGSSPSFNVTTPCGSLP